MTIGELAGLIAALAFAVLVVFVCINLFNLSKILKDFNDTVSRINTTINVLTKDVDNLSIEVEGLLNKANTLVDDVNGKLSKTDPLFVAIGDLGITVSDLNESTKQMTSNLISGSGKKRKPSKSSTIKRFVRSATKTMNSKKDSVDEVEDNIYVEPMTTEEKVEKTANTPAYTESEIFTINNRKPSTTAGEITLEEKG